MLGKTLRLRRISQLSLCGYLFCVNVSEAARIIIILGAALTALGVMLSHSAKLDFFGKLPGDTKRELPFLFSYRNLHSAERPAHASGQSFLQKITAVGTG